MHSFRPPRSWERLRKHQTDSKSAWICIYICVCACEYHIQGSLLLASSLSSLKLLIFWRLGVVSRLLKLVMQNLHFAKLGQRQVRPRLGSSFQHAGVQECCGINLPEVILQHVCPMWRGRNGFCNQSWIARRYVHLAVRHSSPPLCVTVSGGSSRTTAVGSGSDLAAALSLPQLGIFRKWAWAMEKQNGNALNLSSLRRILFSPGTATRRPTTSIPHRRKPTLHCAKCQ